MSLKSLDHGGFESNIREREKLLGLCCGFFFWVVVAVAVVVVVVRGDELEKLRPWRF